MPQHCSCEGRLIGGCHTRCCGQLQRWGGSAVFRGSLGVCLHEKIVKVKSIHELKLVVGAVGCSSSTGVWDLQLRMLG